jgi:hypothetical protein
MQEAVRKKNPSTALRRYPAPEGAGLRGRIARIKAGTKYRYVLEKVEGRWLVSDVYRWLDFMYATPKWQREYDGQPRIFFVSTAYSQ